MRGRKTTPPNTESGNWGSHTTHNNLMAELSIKKVVILLILNTLKVRMFLSNWQKTRNKKGKEKKLYPSRNFVTVVISKPQHHCVTNQHSRIVNQHSRIVNIVTKEATHFNYYFLY